MTKEEIIEVTKKYDEFLSRAAFPCNYPDEEIVQEFAVKKRELQKEYAPIMYHQDEYDEELDKMYREYFIKWFNNQNKL